MKPIAFVGHSGCGKDTACELWADITGGINAKTLSWYITPDILSAYLGAPRAPAILLDRNNRHRYRNLWRDALDLYRRDDPTRLLKDALKRGNITGGLRASDELLAAKALGVFTVWIERPVTHDDTLEFERCDCDISIDNSGTVADLRETLHTLWRFTRCP